MLNKLLLPITFALLFFSAANATGLSGTYTIDPAGSGSTNYTSFRLAVKDINKRGVTGPVVFNVADGWYNEYIEIDKDSGASATNTIIFQSASGDSTKVTLDYTGYGQTVAIYGSSYITFRNMTISFTPGYGKYGDVIQTGESHHITFENNILHYMKGPNSVTDEAVVDGDDSGNDYHIIRNNHIIGANYGIEHDPDDGGSGIWETGNVFCNNTFDSNEYCALHLFNQSKMRIYGNRMNMLSAAGPNGIDISGTRLYGNDSSYIYNNFITTLNGNCVASADAYALCFYNNSFVSLSTKAAVYIYYSSGASGTGSLYNNIIANMDKGYAFEISGASKFTSDYNSFYSASTLGRWNYNVYTDLTLMKKGTKLDAKSISGKPNFVNSKTGDLHATKGYAGIQKKGLPMAIVTNDIDGQIRDLTHPDIGADEINRDSNDIGVTDVNIPLAGTCGSMVTHIQVKIHNYGINDQVNNFNIHVDVSGSTTATQTVAFTDTLHSAKDTTVDVIFSPALNTTGGGLYVLTAYTDLSGDHNTSNDSDQVFYSLYAKPTANFRAVLARCITDSFSFVDSSSLATSWNWSFGDGTTSSIQNPNHLYTATGYYTVTLNVSSTGGCTDSTSTVINVDSCHNLLSGKVSTSHGAALKNSLVYAVLYDSTDTTISMLAHTTTDSSGNYNFSFNPSDSVIFLVAYPDSATYPHEVVTWRDTSLTFQYAKPVRMIAPSTNTVNFYTLSGINNSGTGFIGGKVTICMLCKQGGTGSPAAGIKLVLVDSKGKCYGISYTDFDGNFSFGKLALQDYYIWVDKPMVENVKAPMIALKTGQEKQENLKFTLYPTYLSEDMTTGVGTPSQISDLLQVYPNPFQTSTNISYTLNQASDVSLEVYDLLGKRIANLVNSTQSLGSHSIEFNPQEYFSANAGMYLLKIRMGENVAVKEMILSR